MDRNNDNQEKKFWKVFVEFEDSSIDIADIKRITKKIIFDEESPLPNSVAYVIVFLHHTHPNESVFKFYDEEVRQIAFEDLQERLSDKGVTFI